MSEVMEVVDDIKDKIGDKGFLILIGGVVLLFLYNLSKSSSSSPTTNAMVYASYPDATTNADVIISTLQDNIQYAQDELTDALLETNKNLDTQFTETNHFISSGIASNADLSNKIDSVSGALSSRLDGISNTMSGISTTVSGIGTTVSGISTTVSGIGSTVSGISSGINAQSATLSAIQSQVNKANTSSSGTGALVNAVETSRRNDVSGGSGTIEPIFHVITRPTSNVPVRSAEINDGRASESSTHNDVGMPDKPLTRIVNLSMTSDIKR